MSTTILQFSVLDTRRTFVISRQALGEYGPLVMALHDQIIGPVVNSADDGDYHRVICRDVTASPRGMRGKS